MRSYLPILLLLASPWVSSAAHAYGACEVESPEAYLKDGLGHETLFEGIWESWWQAISQPDSGSRCYGPLILENRGVFVDNPQDCAPQRWTRPGRERRVDVTEIRFTGYHDTRGGPTYRFDWVCRREVTWLDDERDRPFGVEYRCAKTQSP